uniref:Putative secreted protein n=1 Tax=Anopheles darlingi TaxID=43151 RepID=A0A2M4DDW5_ANODA
MTTVCHSPVLFYISTCLSTVFMWHSFTPPSDASTIIIINQIKRLKHTPTPPHHYQSVSLAYGILRTPLFRGPKRPIIKSDFGYHHSRFAFFLERLTPPKRASSRKMGCHP